MLRRLMFLVPVVLAGFPQNRIEGQQAGASSQGGPCSVRLFRWDVEETTDMPFRVTRQDECGFINSGFARIRLDALGPCVSGFAFANDNCVGADVRAQGSGSGLVSVCYEYIGKESGHVQASSTAQISGLVNLRDSDCAAAALGYVQHRLDVFPQPAEAALARSVAETESGSLGSIGLAYMGLTISVTPSVSTGEGVYGDRDVDKRSKTLCGQGTLNSIRKSRGYVEAWANATLFSASVCGEMQGGTGCKLVLGECSQEGGRE